MNRPPAVRPRAAQPAIPDPVPRRIRSLRQARSLTLAELAASASRHLESGARAAPRPNAPASVSTSYLSLIENAIKVPDEPVAIAIARALDDDVRLYRAWVHARKGADLATALAAGEILRTLLVSPLPPRIAAGGETAVARGRAVSRRPPARLRVPVVPEGADPGEGVRPSCEVIEWRGWDAAELSAEHRDRLDRPFAYRLGAHGPVSGRGQPGPGEHVIVLRGFAPPSPDEICAIRVHAGVALSRVIWNGHQLLLRPGDDDTDFTVLDAPDEARLRALILGVALPARFDPPRS